MKTDYHNEYEGDDFQVQSEINVTPFIDVVLVLLIVFMVAAPLATSVISVQLPSVTTTPVSQPDKPLYITLQKDHSFYIGDTLVEEGEFIEVLSEETRENLETKILIKADEEMDYGRVVNVLDQLQAAGYTKIGLVGMHKTLNHSERGNGKGGNRGDKENNGDGRDKGEGDNNGKGDGNGRSNREEGNGGNGNNNGKGDGNSEWR
ncbi:biopolymer transporter ExbD [Bartonella sp. WD12.1]|uniref:biopolymer transporter ExbD n=1 Tax=Bartonella sp. WD12.1 TaxID=1933903 RepID=UPI00099A81B1|nr:biopolymer transporter ExbD [Bartonella sp. WD12.1]OPB30209.1 biopolymer transport protein ExbD [Bartonella sp. WD12.1]